MAVVMEVVVMIILVMEMVVVVGVVMILVVMLRVTGRGSGNWISSLNRSDDPRI